MFVSMALVVRHRISGGGAVYRDLNNLNYTIITKESEDQFLTSRATPVNNTLAELGVKLNSLAAMT